MPRIRYFGHSSFQLMYDDDTSIFIDPFFSPEGRDNPSAAKGAAWVRKCDAIFITHEHHDHFEPETVTEIAERTWASVIGPKQVISALRIPEKFKVSVQTGDTFTLKGMKVEVVKAIHPQSTYPVGYIIEKGGIRVYHAGDTYEHAGMVDLKCDWALLPIVCTYTIDIQGAEKAAKEMRAKYAVPMHYSTWDKISQSPREFEESFRGSRVTPVIMKFGEERELTP
ncbi:Hydroxyacylglutathione hydrolase [uncultured archaeon]|nr:Hydroxyacylglutathione hydrolase [uncultured archaeon]